MRVFFASAALLAVLGVPSDLTKAYPFDSGLWFDIAHAIFRVRLESQQTLPSEDQPLTFHTVTVIGIFKPHPKLPSVGSPVVSVEARGFMYTEDGCQPTWTNDQPLPIGTEVTVYVGWEPDLQAFWLGTVHGLNFPGVLPSKPPVACPYWRPRRW